MMNHQHHHTPDPDGTDPLRNGNDGNSSAAHGGEVSIEELLSAAHDGELSPGEQQRLALALQSSPALQEQLEEMQDLSTVLRSLHRPPAPQTMKRVILERVTSSTASTSTIASADSVPRSRGGRFWRSPLFLWGTSIAAAAMVVVAVQFSGQFPAASGPSELSHSVSSPDSEAITEQPEAWGSQHGGSVTALEQASDHDRLAQADSFGANSGSPENRLQVQADSVPSLPAAAAPPGSMVSAAPRGAAMMKSMAPQPGELALPEMKPAFFEGMAIDPHLPPNIGDEFSTFLTQGDLVAQVTARVVDVDPMGDHTLILMRGESLKILSSDQTAGSKEDLQKRFGVPEDGEMVIVFWQAPAAQIAQVKLELDHFSLASSDDESATADHWGDRRVALSQAAPESDGQWNARQNLGVDESAGAAAAMAGAALSDNVPDDGATVDRKPTELNQSRKLANAQLSESPRELGQRPPSPKLPDSNSTRSEIAPQSGRVGEVSRPAPRSTPAPAPSPNAEGDGVESTLPLEAQRMRRATEQEGITDNESSQSQASAVTTESFGIRLSLTEYQQLQSKIANLPQTGHLLNRLRETPTVIPLEKRQEEAKKESSLPANERPDEAPPSTAAKTGEAARPVASPPAESKPVSPDPGITVILYSVSNPPSKAAPKP